MNFEFGIFQPRMMWRPQLAAYLGVTPSTIDRWVELRLIPRPKYLGRRPYWDFHEVSGRLFGKHPHEERGRDEVPARRKKEAKRRRARVEFYRAKTRR